MDYLDQQRGRFVTVLPRARLEDREFRKWLPTNEPGWTPVWDRPDPRRRRGPRDRWYVVKAPLPSCESWPVIWVWSLEGHRPPLNAERADIARYVRDLVQRPSPRGTNIVSLDSGVGLANATLQQRLVVVRLFYDHLIEERRRDTNPVGRGRYTPGRGFGGHRDRGLIPRFTKLPWIPTDAEWQRILGVARHASLRTRLMLALAYDAGLRREELCRLQTDDVDPAYRTVRVRAETTKRRRSRVVPYSVTTGLLFQQYLQWRRELTAARGLLFLSESRRNRTQPLTLWTWSKVVRALAVRADVPRFSTHTPRHLCLTDLARSGWELHAIARFAGHRNVATTLQYIHLSGRDLAAKLARGMAEVHAWRRAALAELVGVHA